MAVGLTVTNERGLGVTLAHSVKPDWLQGVYCDLFILTGTVVEN